MGTAREPVAGSGCWPACTASVSSLYCGWLCALFATDSDLPCFSAFPLTGRPQGSGRRTAGASRPLPVAGARPRRARPVRRNSDDMGGMKTPLRRRRGDTYIPVAFAPPSHLLRTARLRRAAVLQNGTAAANELPVAGFIGPILRRSIRVEATCAIQLSRRSTLRVVYPRLAAVSTKNFALSQYAGRRKFPSQVPAKRRRQASFGAEEDERGGGGRPGGEPGRRRGLPAGRQGEPAGGVVAVSRSVHVSSIGSSRCTSVTVVCLLCSTYAVVRCSLSALPLRCRAPASGRWSGRAARACRPRPGANGQHHTSQPFSGPGIIRMPTVNGPGSYSRCRAS